jgi:hypothetical protein
MIYFEYKMLLFLTKNKIIKDNRDFPLKKGILHSILRNENVFKKESENG